jgi:Lamin Tail Domain
MRWTWVVAFVVGACGSGAAPDILGLGDQVAVVGQQFILELDGVDPDGDALTYKVESDLTLEGNATLSKTPAGRGLFRWTPVGSDVGMHAFDFTASDGSNSTTVTITIDVRASSGNVPVFRQPLGAGRVVNLVETKCVDLDILIEDQDTAQVTIGEEAPPIAGATLEQLDGTTAHWRWCPSPAQVAESDRYTLVLYADDDDNPKTIKNYVIVLGGGGNTGLVINEIDYDNVGTDTTEYLELFNASGASIALAGRQVILINGATNAPYQTIDLSPLGSLGAGKYLVIAPDTVTVPAGVLQLDPLWSQDQLQNGAPDGVVLVDSVTKTVLDAIAYEGAITAATLPDFPAAVSLVEGTALDAGVADSNTATKTLCRKANGVDTNNSNADWALCGTRTVGTPNQP